MADDKHYEYKSPYLIRHRPTAAAAGGNKYRWNMSSIFSVRQVTNSPAEPPRRTPPPWGAIYWRFFHVMAARITSDEYFRSARNDILDCIRGVCTNLPCPYCRVHATEYINNTNWNLIQSKADLQWYFYYFHNEVNANKKLPLFAMEDLSPTYGAASFRDAVAQFIRQFMSSSNDTHQMGMDMARKRLGARYKVWIDRNMDILWEI